MKILAVYNIKGGVGKTSTAVNLAYLCAEAGYRTLVWDLDPQGAASFYFRVKPKVKGGGKSILDRKQALDKRIKGTDFENLDLLPADFSYRHLDLLLGKKKKAASRLPKQFESQSKDYDVIIFDCPPSISLLSEAVFLTADALLVPMIPTVLSQRTYDQLLHFRRKHGLDRLQIMAFFCMVDRRKRLHKELVESLPETRPFFLETAVPYASSVERMGLERKPLPDFDRSSPASKAYRSLWEEVREKLLGV